MKVYKEITTLTKNDVFVILNSENIGFDYPIHSHPAYELTLVMHSKGNRIVGDSVQKYEGNDLVLIGSEVYHKWDDDYMPPNQRSHAHVITLQFAPDLINSGLFSKDAFTPIQQLLSESQRGIRFQGTTLEEAIPILVKLTQTKGFDSIVLFLELLQKLALSTEKNLLASAGFMSVTELSKENRINRMYSYILQHYNDPELRISDLADTFNMSTSAFGHFFKKCTNKSFTQFVIDLRLGYASRLLLNSNDSISEIAYMTGFNNLANFNRLFKKNKHITPKQYRRELLNKNRFDWEHQNTPNLFVPGDHLVQTT